MQQYYVQNSHPAIVSADVFDMVQSELARYKKSGRNRSGKSCFSGRLVCGECGGYFGSKVWHSTSKYRRTVWQCNRKFGGGKKCRTPHLYEEDIRQEFLKTLNTMISNKEAVFEDGERIKAMLADTGALDAEIRELQGKAAVAQQLLRRCVEENTRAAIDQDSYREKYNETVERYERITAELEKAQNTREERIARAAGIDAFVAALKARDLVALEFDEEVWNLLVDTALVGPDGGLEFRLRGGAAESQTLSYPVL